MPVLVRIAIQSVSHAEQRRDKKHRFEASTIVMFCQILASVALRGHNLLSDAGHAVLEQRRVSGLKRHVRTSSTHGHADGRPGQRCRTKAAAVYGLRGGRLINPWSALPMSQMPWLRVRETLIRAKLAVPRL